MLGKMVKPEIRYADALVGNMVIGNVNVENTDAGKKAAVPISIGKLQNTYL